MSSPPSNGSSPKKRDEPPRASRSPAPKHLYLPASASLEDITTTLTSAGIPVASLSECAGCVHENECDDSDLGGGGEFGDSLGKYPARFGADMTSRMIGSIKPYSRQVIISTGVSNWAAEITFESGSLASYISSAYKSVQGKRGPLSLAMAAYQNVTEEKPSLMDTTRSGKLTVLNGSIKTVSEDHESQTVLILPDYTYVRGVRENAEDAEELCKTRLVPTVRRAAKSQANSTRLETRPLPYDCVLLICSHKRRDNKCGIAAPILERALKIVLEARGWEVHTEIEVDDSVPSFEERAKTTAMDTLEAQIAEEMKRDEGNHGFGKRALIVQTSHFGGHKFAGNLIVCSPRGTNVWYGRVSPKEIPAVVDETIIGGKIISDLLRAAVNVSEGRGRGFYDW
ncbi:hypothetical protein DL93DRAFT_2061407 [Clavulina sp. PMI_390]|nr:hypothetical protein DL93DRAFT_2061407 [Clavulina sp. PMI_390]